MGAVARYFSAMLVAMIDPMSNGRAHAVSSMLYDNTACGFEGILQSYLAHAMFSGWPIFRLAEVLAHEFHKRVRVFDEDGGVGGA